MNHDDQNKPDLSTLIDPELEARIVAWVSGEASPFEASELTRLTNEKPELAIFKRRIEAVRGLVAEAIRPDPESLRFSPDRRAKLLQAIGATENKTAPTASTNTVVLPMAATMRKQRKDRRWMFGIAASLAIGLFTVFSLQYHQMSGSMEMKKKYSRIEEYDTDAKKMELSQAAITERERDLRAREVAYQAALEPAAKRQFERSVEPQDFVMADKTNRQQEAKEEAAAYKQKLDLDGKRRMEREAQDRLSAQRQTYGAITYRPQVTPGSPPPPAAVGEADNLNYRNVNPPALADGHFNTELKDDGASKSYSLVKKADQKSPPILNEAIAGPEEFRVSSLKGGTAQPIAMQKLSINPKLVAYSDQFGDIPQAPASPASAPRAGGIADINNRFLVGADKKANADPFVLPRDATLASAQELLALSPFAISSAKDQGYAAQDSSAAAGRKNPVNLKVKAAADAFVPVTEGHLGEYQKFLPKPSRDPHAEPIAADRDGQTDNEDDKPLVKASNAQRYTPKPDLTSEINASKEPVSTFSLHVSDVSFHLAQAALAKGEEPDAERVRPEEFYNAFSYGDPTPALAEKVSCRIEQAAHPFVQQRNLVRIAVKVAASGRDAAQPLHLTVLLDTSGSMEREDRAATIQSAMKALTSLLGPNDRLTLIGFSRQPRLLAESLTGDQAAQVLDLIKNTPAEGGTNLEEALKLGSELAHRQFAANAQNRIVLLTDGAANLGNANPAQLAVSIEALRQQGIAFDACGVGLEGLDDGMLENLTRKGDGRYYVLNSPEAAEAGFAKQLAGAFRPAAENVKLQVRFNPARVGNYRLIGFEQHRLKEEDFRNDKVDAAELAAEEAAVAVYQVEVLPQGEGELGEVYVRFRDTASGNMVERNWTLNYDAQAAAFDRTNPSMQLAGTAALLAEKLQGGEAGNAINLGDLAPVVNKLRSHYANEPRVQELVTMFEQARKLAGE